MATRELKLAAIGESLRGTRPLGAYASGTRPLRDPLGEDEPGRVSPAMASKIRSLISKLRAMLAMVPPELRGKLLALIASAEGALAGFWIGDIGALISLMERTVALLNQLAGWGDLRDLRALAARAYWDRRRVLAELNQLLAGVTAPATDSRAPSPVEPDPIRSLAAMIEARF